MGQYLDWTKMIIMFILLFGIQWMTRIKAVADGMVFKELIEHHDMNANEIVQRMKDEVEKMNKEDLN